MKPAFAFITSAANEPAVRRDVSSKLEDDEEEDAPVPPPARLELFKLLDDDDVDEHINSSAISS